MIRARIAGPEYRINGACPVRRNFWNLIRVSALRREGHRVDAMDWAILRELQADARLSFSGLSRRVHLSPPAVAERVRRLEESGVITGYHAHIDLERVERPLLAIVEMSCYGPNCILRDQSVTAWPEVLEFHRVVGDPCSLLKIATTSVEAFEGVVDRLARYGQPSSTLVLSSPLRWKPIDPLPTTRTRD
jgi:Lrp/AsnC family leucine-responsive transcriptional regulator